MAHQRIEWLALLRGLNILLVVMYHVQLIDMTTGENHVFCEMICEPFKPFRMPLFIFCSGGLLYLSRINKKWTVRQLYIDKVNRILVPLIFFVTFYYFFKLSLNPLIKTKVIFSIGNFLESFFIYSGHPSAHLWFLSVLFWMMLLYPLFRWLCEDKIRMIVFLLFTIGIYFIELDVPANQNYFLLFSLNKYMVYFFAGIFFFRFELYHYFKDIISFFLTVTGYIICYVYNIPLLISIMGILCMISLSYQLTRLSPTLFSSFREYIYQIFLMSFIFQPFVELILWKKLFYNESLFYLFYLLNILSGLYMPVLVSKLVERYGNKWMKICMGLKSYY